MSLLSSPAIRKFVTTPLSRIIGSLAGWFLYLLSFTLLALCFVDVASVGGFCASGQSAYVIAHQCPPGADIFVPWVVFSGLIAVGIGAGLSNGFGVPLVVWAWPILFCVLGVGFFLAGGGVGIALGAMFEIMGAVPLVLELSGGIKRVFIGSNNVRGVRLIERQDAKKSLLVRSDPNPPDAVPVTAGDVLLSLVLFLLGAGGGIYVALVWYASVAAPA